MLTSQSQAVNVTDASRIGTLIAEGLSKVILGREDTIRLVLTGLFADGHVLLEDYPGSGKTTLTKALGQLITGRSETTSYDPIIPFRRIQFTPDMLPSDILGVNIFEPKSGSFRFVHGPIFAHIVLADELNRTGPKVQAAFLECMAEKQVTIDNVTHQLDDFFFVVGTQNPLDLAGTYPLPLVQLDRFLLRIPMSYVDSETELQILKQHRSIHDALEHLKPVCSHAEIVAAQRAVQTVHIDDSIRRAIVRIVQASREHPLLQLGVSTRAALMLQKSIAAFALLDGREYATEDDLKFLLPYVLLHRMRFQPGVKNPAEALYEIAGPALEELIRR
jgi:MoxR-like ATPase